MLEGSRRAAIIAQVTGIQGFKVEGESSGWMHLAQSCHLLDFLSLIRMRQDFVKIKVV